MSQLRDAVAAATQGTPYTVVDTERGFDLQLDIADARWWGAFNRAGLTYAFRWRVAEHGTSYTVTDAQTRLEWVAGAPRVSAAWQAQLGRSMTLAREKIWALSEHGRIEPVVDYRFNADEGSDLIRLAAGELGLTERWPLSMKIGLFFALATVAGFVVSGPLLLALGQPVWFASVFTGVGVLSGALVWLVLRLVS